MRICVIGASGQLGTALARAFRRDHDVVEAVRRPRAGQVAMDLTRPETVTAALDAARPDLVLLAGAYCNVDGAESDRAEAMATNVEGPRGVASWARARGARVTYYSTDHVFDGTAAGGYAEEDAPHPVNVYAASKLEGERVVKEALPSRHLVLRTAWLYGPDPAHRNFLLRLVDRLRAGERVRVPSDQWGTPTYTEDLAAATRHLVEAGATGTFHAVGPELISRTDLAARACAVFGLDPAAVLPVATRELGQAAARPLRVRLDCARLHRTGAPPFREVAAGLAALREWRTRPAEAAAAR